MINIYIFIIMWRHILIVCREHKKIKIKIKCLRGHAINSMADINYIWFFKGRISGLSTWFD